MAFNLENFKNRPPIVIIKDEDINGLSFFKKRLEQLFFSDVVIRNSDSKRKTAKLIIEISCNFKLHQGMSNLKAGIWAQLRNTSDQQMEKSEFHSLVLQLQERNTFPIEVEEFSLLFNDCNIIINKLYKRSIPEQLDAILTKLANNYAVLTKGMRQVPFEIFIPVFEEDVNCCLDDTNTLVAKVSTEEHEAEDYFNFWALYFESHVDAFMFNLQKSAIINGELNMLKD